jgi:dienelactone hydrolase
VINPRIGAVALTLTMALAALSPALVAAQDDGAVELAPVESTLLQLSTLAPTTWTDAGGGVYSRDASVGDATIVAVQSAPVTNEQLWPGLLPQLGLVEAPAVEETRTTDHLTWDIFSVDVPAPPVSVRLALAEQDGQSYVVLLQSAPDEHAALVQAVFDPVLAATAPLEPEPTTDPGSLGYESEAVTFSGGNEAIELAGTLTLPAGPGPHPMVVLMSGSGPQDRDSSLRPVSEMAPFALIADALTTAGVGVLRYDDRGVGGSSGVYADATIPDLTADAGAAVEYLTTRDDVDATQIGVLGHSEGAIYAAALAADDPNVAFAVSLAGPATDGLTAILDQQAAVLRSMGTPDDAIDEAVANNGTALNQALEGDLEAAEATLREVYSSLWDIFEPTQQEAVGSREDYAERQAQAQVPSLASPQIRSLMATDAALDWQRISLPVLAIYGGKDNQAILDQNEPAMRAALEASDSADFEVITLPDANHLFQAAETGYLSEYGQLAPEFTSELLPTLVGWITDHVVIAQ